MIDQRVAKADPQLRSPGWRLHRVLEHSDRILAVARRAPSASAMRSQLSSAVKLPKKACRASVSGTMSRPAIGCRGRAAEAGPALKRIAGRAEQQRRCAAACSMAPRTPQQPQRAKAERDQQQQDQPAHQRLRPDAPADQPRADQQQARSAPATAARRRARRSGVADPAAVAPDQPGADRGRAFRPLRSAGGPDRACRRPVRHRNRRSTGPGRRGSAAPPSAPAPCASWRASGSWRLAQ